jgi:lipoic acid synthetase
VADEKKRAGGDAPLRRSLIPPGQAETFKWNTGGRPAAEAGGGAPPGRRPEWLKAKLPSGRTYQDMREMVQSLRLNTVCQSANCPNIGECWNERHVTLMILGHTCTRSCGFCDVLTGRPAVVDHGEPSRVATAVRLMGLDHVVITSVDRDDLPDGGAAVWAETIRQVRAKNPETTIEVLVPDFKGEIRDIDAVLAAGPDVFAHNIETVQRLQKPVRPQASYGCSLSVLRHASGTGVLTKSGIMAGLGETEEEIVAAMQDLAGAAIDILTIGQYLRPSPRHLPVDRWVTPEEFARLKQAGEALGIRHVESGPLVRSSYRAGRQVRELLAARAGGCSSSR